MRKARFLLAAAFAASITAQEPAAGQPPEPVPAHLPKLRCGVGYELGRFRHRDEEGGRFVDASADGYHVEVEGNVRDGVGLGCRYQHLEASDPGFTARDDQLFLHATLTPLTGRLSLPIRIGLAVGDYDFAAQGAGSSRNWFGYGPRIEVVPDLALLADNELRWSLRAGLGGEGGVTSVSGHSPDLGHQTGDMSMYDLALGMHLATAHLEFGVDWVFARTEYGRSTDLDEFPLSFADYPGAKTSFSGLLFSFGVHW